MIKKNVFIGPLPPPIGGVAVINESIQNIILEGYQTVSFNTSSDDKRENLYSGLKLKSFKRNLSLKKKLINFIEIEKPAVVNIFITSGLSIVRDIIFLRTLGKYNVPIVIHFHSKISGEFALVPWRLKLVANFFNKYATKIILLSDYHLRFFSNFFNKQKCFVLENFVQYDDFRNEISNKDNSFLYVGRLSKEKGFFDLIEAVRILSLKEVYFTIKVIGLAPTNEIEQEINMIIDKYKLNEYFDFCGAVFGKEKYNLFKKTFCLIFPSQFENSPVVIKEAIAAKMAILASNIQANKNILENHNNHLYFESKNSIGLAEVIEKILTNHQLVLEMCENSEKVIEYDIEFAKQKLTILYNELTSN